MNFNGVRSKNIAVIGGGISGLATLHYLLQKYSGRQDIQIKLFEKEKFPGGTIHSQLDGINIFENGPNGFLSINPRTLQFFEEMNLSGSLIYASKAAKKRFISYHRKLYQLPGNPQQFFNFPLLTFKEKLSLFKDLFKPKGVIQEESVFEFVQRRFGRRVAELFIDPLVSGIYAGNAKEISIKAAFPRIYELEQTHGSVVKGLLKNKKKSARQLVSLQNGMGEVVACLYKTYRPYIETKIDLQTIKRSDGNYRLKFKDGGYSADEVFSCVPAYAASQIMADLDATICKYLEQIEYAPIVVIGLVYSKAIFQNKLHGFGYLIPSFEKRKVLGVLFESNIFEKRCDNDHVLLRVMIGGSRHPDVIKLNQEELIFLAREEVETIFNLNAPPVKVYSKIWPRGIPQYTKAYLKNIEQLNKLMSNLPGFYCSGNYLNGVSFNDCIENAYESAQKSSL